MKQLLRLAIIGIIGTCIVVVAIISAGRSTTTTTPPRPTFTEVDSTKAPIVDAPTIAPEPTAAPRGYLSEAMLGEKWPLTVSEGTIACSGTAILFQTSQGLYAVNGTARGQREANGWKDIFDIAKPDPSIAGATFSLQPLLDVGLKLCS